MMRDYAKIGPTFWTGKTGKEIKKRGANAVVMAAYLMSSPHSNMLGLYYQPLLYAAHETGLGLEGATEGLQSCVEAGFCAYDRETEMVWVFEMAQYQIAEALEVKDNRCKGVQKDYDALQECPFLGEFFDKYAAAFHMTKRRGSEGALKPLRSQEQEQEQEQKQDLDPTGSCRQADDGLPACPHDEIIRQYHLKLPELPQVKLKTDGRQKAMRSFWRWVLTSKRSDGQPRASTADQALTWISSYFERASTNDFLMGRAGGTRGHENWRCDLDFLLTERGRKHVIERTVEA